MSKLFDDWWDSQVKFDRASGGFHKYVAEEAFKAGMLAAAIMVDERIRPGEGRIENLATLSMDIRKTAEGDE